MDEVAREAELVFGALTAQQVNWRPDATRWSVAQCFDHLVAANRVMLRAASEAMDDASPRTIWQRLPLLPAVLGRMLIRSQAPQTTRKFKASPLAAPAASDLAPDIIERFVVQQRELIAWLQPLDERRAARAIMPSPFIRVVTYSVLDGVRVIVAHNWRHFEQARRVTSSPGFPSALPLP